MKWWEHASFVVSISSAVAAFFTTQNAWALIAAIWMMISWITTELLKAAISIRKEMKKP